MFKLIIRNPDGTVYKSKIYESDNTFLKWWVTHTKRYTLFGMKVEPYKYGRFAKWRKLTVGDILRIEEKKNAERQRKAKKGKEKA